METEAQGTEQTVSTGTETTQVETSTAAASVPETTATSTIPGETAQPSQPAYQPNYKFWAEKKEHEIPEKWRSLITDAESEKEAKELFQKAYGIDAVKELREQIKGEYKQYKEQADPVIRTVQSATQSYQRAVQAFNSGNKNSAIFNFENTLQALGIPPNVVQQYTLLKLQHEDLSPEQKASYNQQRTLEQQTLEQKTQLEQIQAQYQALSVQQRTNELSQTLSKPEVSGIVQAWDQRNGPGSFQQEIIRQGQMHFYQTGQDVSAEQLVGEMIKRYGLSSPMAPQASVNQPAKELPVIPVAKGGGRSPTAMTIQSTDDMRKAYDQMMNQ